MIAIIKTGGKQYKVREKDIIQIEKLNKKEGSEVLFKNVLLVSDEEGKKIVIGTPQVKEAQVTARVLEEKKGKKITVIKYKPKVRYKRKRGHRQWYTAVRIEKIVG